ncbi:MAG: putative lipid II flippase FtsW [Ruminococcaceae bacterium]|nr:putative lipid II flippase FtsW [Oscillospiraceae bacterium]
MDMPLLFLTLFLLAMGVIMVLSASFASAYYDLQGETGGNAAWYFIRQLVFALAGVAVMLFCSRLPMDLYYRLSPLVMAAAVAALALVLVVGVEVNGAKRWISLGFTTFQPSEIVKVALILFASRLICHRGDKMRTFRWGIAPFALLLLLVVGLLVLEPHFSASIIVLAIAAVMLFVGGVKLGWFIGAGGILLVGAVIAVSFVPYVAARVEAFRDPFSDLSGKGWQIVQSLYAIGSGGFLGLGLGQSRQKYLYLPEEHNDFIFAVVCEELGFLGAGLILCLFALLIIRGYTIAIHAANRYSFLVGVGISSMLALQTFLNVAVCTNLIPCTGISLPLFSYGGTALLIQLAEIGILLSVSREMPGNR